MAALIVEALPWLYNLFGALAVVTAFVVLLVLAAAAGGRDCREWYTRQAQANPESGIPPRFVPPDRSPPPVLLPIRADRLDQLEEVVEVAGLVCDEYDDVLELLEEAGGPGGLDFAVLQLGMALDRIEELDREELDQEAPVGSPGVRGSA